MSAAASASHSASSARVSSRAAKKPKAKAGAGGADGAEAAAKPGFISTYFSESRNAVYSFLLAVPFVLTYEIGIYFNKYKVLNGGDWLLRQLMTALSPEHAPLASLGALVIAFLAYQFVRNDSLKVKKSVLFGLTLEAAFYAILLIPLAAWSVAFLQHLGPAAQSVAAGAPAATPAAYIAQAGQLSAQVQSPELQSRWSRIVLFCGAGVYEELVFRVLMLWALFGIGMLCKLPKWVNVLQSAIGSALIFSLFHYFPQGPYPFEWATFIYRALAGLYFTSIVYTRNFGVAVASHAMYDMMVG